MTGGGFLISLDVEIFNWAARAVIQLGGRQALDEDGEGMAQYTDDTGRLFTLYERVPEGSEWEVYGEPITAAHGVQRPDMKAVYACPFVCRWSDLAVNVADAIARAAKAPTWLLDGNGVLWDAEVVDPLKLQL